MAGTGNYHGTNSAGHDYTSYGGDRGNYYYKNQDCGRYYNAGPNRGSFYRNSDKGYQWYQNSSGERSYKPLGNGAASGNGVSVKTEPLSGKTEHRSGKTEQIKTEQIKTEHRSHRSDGTEHRNDKTEHRSHRTEQRGDKPEYRHGVNREGNSHTTYGEGRYSYKNQDGGRYYKPGPSSGAFYKNPSKGYQWYENPSGERSYKPCGSKKSADVDISSKMSRLSLRSGSNGSTARSDVRGQVASGVAQSTYDGGRCLGAEKGSSASSYSHSDRGYTSGKSSVSVGQSFVPYVSSDSDDDDGDNGCYSGVNSEGNSYTTYGDGSYSYENQDGGYYYNSGSDAYYCNADKGYQWHENSDGERTYEAYDGGYE